MRNVIRFAALAVLYGEIGISGHFNHWPAAFHLQHMAVQIQHRRASDGYRAGYGHIFFQIV